ncbi:MAG: ornithine carbamoyltransferase [Bdellovibrionales bacterium]|nr:ornithine carbamoyltransferase [Bdellovibrionales bacterium]
MIKFKTNHIKTGEELHPNEISELIDFAIFLKKERQQNKNKPYLLGKQIALLFNKPSLRTRFSFNVAVNELGGACIESVGTTRKYEDPEDLALVLGGYCHGIMVRTHEDKIIERMAQFSKVPVINGLSQLHHPCQILADLMTLKEVFGKLDQLTVSYIGDGNNILHSLLLMAPQMGIHIKYSCPKGYQPNSLVLQKAKGVANASGLGSIIPCVQPQEAVTNSHVVYTDVWTSMGFEEEDRVRNEAFAGYQVNEALMEFALPHAKVMHCLPMVKGKEISETLPYGDSSVIFHQSENRLHVQKALLIGLLAKME